MFTINHASQIAKVQYANRTGLNSIPQARQINDITELALAIAKTKNDDLNYLDDLNEEHLEILCKLLYIPTFIVEEMAKDMVSSEDLQLVISDLNVVQCGSIDKIAKNEYATIVKMAELQYFIHSFADGLVQDPKMVDFASLMINDKVEQLVKLVKLSQPNDD